MTVCMAFRVDKMRGMDIFVLGAWIYEHTRMVIDIYYSRYRSINIKMQNSFYDSVVSVSR
jgi:hypothetical protein